MIMTSFGISVAIISYKSTPFTLIMNLIASILIISLYILSFKTLHKNVIKQSTDILQSELHMKKFGFFYERFRLNNKLASSFIVFTFIRKILLIVILVLF